LALSGEAGNEQNPATTARARRYAIGELTKRTSAAELTKRSNAAGQPKVVDINFVCELTFSVIDVCPRRFFSQ
jgi:hypothetical protein